MIAKEIEQQLICDHCGDDCVEDTIMTDQHSFCCNGCQMVYMLLHENGMGDYYRFEANPGISQRKASNTTFDYLDDDEIVSKLLVFRESGIAKVNFHLPQIHCSSCLWLLEHLSMLDEGVTKCTVNFTSKKATITYREDATNLRAIVTILDKIGYPPRINYDHLSSKDRKKTPTDKSLLYKLGLAGFAFGNIMLLSFPEYLGFDKASYLFHIGYINIVLATPVLLYSASGYLKSAYKGLRMGTFNIDLPIALGMAALYGRSLYEILGQHGEGYLDSFAGFVFFLLIGRWFQTYTYQALDFDRNYKSYFPISATVLVAENWITKSLDQLSPGDIIRIKNQELIPADSILQKGKGRIDYSFVTGEADLISKQQGDLLYAGGRHQGDSIEVVLTKSVDQSYLTQLWNEDTFKKREQSQASRLIGSISKYFTLSVIVLALATMTYWLYVGSDMAVSTFTAVLIVACPCALALAVPFTYGNILRLLATRGLYLRNVHTIEDIQDIDYVIFDKTGTLTDSSSIEISYRGKPLGHEEKIIVRSACSHSSHPLSRAIVRQLSDSSVVDIDSYEDVIGAGLIAECDGHRIRLGSSDFIFGTEKSQKEQGVYIEIDGRYLGCFKFNHAFRANIKSIVDSLNGIFTISVLSGDTNHEESRIRELLGYEAKVYFNQSPKDKLQKIKSLQAKGHKVMMIGDGLNDAGALKQSNVGIVISDEANNFSPACDGILDAATFPSLYQLISYIRDARYIIYGAFLLAFLYNSIGLYYAMTGQLSPVIAAILMPLSSITVIVYGVVASYLRYKSIKQ